MDVQFERNRRCNVDYNKAGYPRKAVRYRSTLEVKRDYTSPVLSVILVKEENRGMTEKEIGELDIRLAFYYESAIVELLAKGVIVFPRTDANYIIE